MANKHFEERYRHNIPPGTAKNTCKQCGNPIYWLQSKAGKWFTANLDGTFHGPKCEPPDEDTSPIQPSNDLENSDVPF